MGSRLTRIYTRTGDHGTTGLAGGRRVSKDDARIEAIGAIDELNSLLAVVLAHPLPEEARRSLTRIQNELFDLGGELSLPERAAVDAAAVARLEQTLDAMNAGLPPLQEFILPGGGPAGAACQLARAVCRRAERRLVTLARQEAVRPEPLAYLNRLSDLLFVMARLIAHAEGRPEVYWRPTPSPG